MNRYPHGILIVDDSRLALAALERLLLGAGYDNVQQAGGVPEALDLLGIGENGSSTQEVQPFDLVLMDIVMPVMDGIEGCHVIRGTKKWRDLPIIMVTAKDDMGSLKRAFDAGAMDYVTKPIQEVELLARIHSALTLKGETDRRKAREADLLEITSKLAAANQRLRALSSKDGLTGVANRRWFDETLEREWRRAKRSRRVLNMAMIDIDHFKKYNDHYGHLPGDDCLKKVAAVLQQRMRRAGDLVARYGGEEFVVVMPEMDTAAAKTLAEELRAGVEQLDIPHEGSQTSRFVTVSIGGGGILPGLDNEAWNLVEMADQAMYRAKNNGRNQVCWDES